MKGSRTTVLQQHARLPLPHLELCGLADGVLVVNFLQQDLPQRGPFPKAGAAGTDGQAGALGKGQRTSTALLLFNAFWAYVMPLLGMFLLAPRYFGLLSMHRRMDRR